MSAKHTPGPWGILSAAIGPACMAFSIGKLNEEKGLDGVSDEYAVCVVPLIHDESRPNAALIAAAPEMFDALKWAEAFITVLDDDNLQDDLRKGVTNMLEDIRAALRKAKRNV